MVKRFLTVVVLIWSTVTMVAQVTTAGISGIVTAGGEEAIGATVTAKHVPSGAVYRAVTNIDGQYTMTGMRAGGPYEVEITYIGFQTQQFTGVQLQLGQNSVISANLTEGGELLAEVTIVGSKNNTMRSDRSGAVTNLNADAMSVVPSVARSVTDLAKLTPQSASSSGVVETSVSPVSPSMVPTSITPSDWAVHHSQAVEPPSHLMPSNR